VLAGSFLSLLLDPKDEDNTFLRNVTELNHTTRHHNQDDCAVKKQIKNMAILDWKLLAVINDADES
jgi:hypothetical protein